MYMYILYLGHENIILAILSKGLPNTAILAGEWLNSVIFHGNIKYIEHMIINVRADYNHVASEDYSFRAKFSGNVE